MQGMGARRREGEGREGVQRRIRGSEIRKLSGWQRGLLPHLRHMRVVVVSSPGQAAGAPRTAHWLRRRASDRGRGSVRGLWCGRLTLSS